MKNKQNFLVLAMIVLSTGMVMVGCASLAAAAKPADAADIPPVGQERLLSGGWTTGTKDVRFDGINLFSTGNGISPAGTFRYSYDGSTLTLGIKTGFTAGFTKKTGSATLSADGKQLTLDFGDSGTYAGLNGQYTKQ
jgi:hypothetical protein